jgi:hypothetical protein
MSGLRDQQPAAAFVSRFVLRLVEVAVQKQRTSLFALRERNK